MNNRIIIFLLLSLLATPSVAQGVTVQNTFTFSQNEALEKAIQRLHSDSVLRHGQIGICVMDVNSSEILASSNATMSLIPASNMKIATTAAGLKILGNDFTYKTDLQYDGSIRDSVLFGNIIIKGYGDPTLGSPLMDNAVRMREVLDSFTIMIKKLGINAIQGKIIGDGSAFERSMTPATWSWGDLGNYYGAGPSGLNFNENLYELNFTQNPTIGSPPSVSGTTPHVPNYKMHNEVLSKDGGGDNAYIYSAPYSSTGVVKGTIPAGLGNFNISGALPDPPFFAAWHLKQNLIEKGVTVSDSAVTQTWLEQNSFDIPTRTTFFTWQSPRLSTIVERTNMESVNLYSEAILRTIAFQATGYGSNEAGTDIIKKFWTEKGVDTEGFFMNDGSGLSPRNGITPLQMANMLRIITTDSQWFMSFYQSLPEAGLTGTMKGMFKKYPSVIGKIRAKSGSISRVRSYSGYATATDGRLIAFALILNNFTCSQTDIRKRIEEFMAELVKL